MSINIGITGLPKSGRTTIFNGLTRGKSTVTQTAKSLESYIGKTTVPEPRLEVLANILYPKKVTFPEAQYIDIGASVKSLAADDKGISGKLLNELSRVDALLSVVRAFDDESVPHPKGSLDVDRDIVEMDLELTFSDIAIIERRLKRLETSLKAATQAERQTGAQEQSLLMKLKAVLENNVPIRELQMTPGEDKTISSYQFLTGKPLIIAVNIGEDRLFEASNLEATLNTSYAQPKRRLLALCGKLETELAQLDDEAATEFRADFGIEESGLDRVVKVSYELLGLVSFFTTVSEELRAWSIPRDTTAQKAAGKIHSDMERGFIRAEVITCNDLLSCNGDFVEARKKGLIRSEGKEYIIQDGDIVTFLFNV
jgi:ribosome-binding ATPase